MRTIAFFAFALCFISAQGTWQPMRPNQYPGIPRPDTILINRPNPPQGGWRFRREVEQVEDAELTDPLPQDRNARSILPDRNEKPNPLILVNRPTIPRERDVLRFRRDVQDEEHEIDTENVEPQEVTREKRSFVRRPVILPPVRVVRDVDASDELRGREKRSRYWQQPWSGKPTGGHRGSRSVENLSGDDESVKQKRAVTYSNLLYTYRPRRPLPPRLVREALKEVTEDVSTEFLEREKRWTQNNNGAGASNKGDRGSWGVSVNKDKGRGPQVRTEAQGNVYTSPKGNVRVDAHGHHEFGKGRKPDYGGGVKVEGRWRRSAEEEEVEEEAVAVEEEATRVRRQADKRGSVSVSVNKDKGSGPQVRTDAQYKAWQSKNGNWQVNGGAFHEAGRGRKPSYGGGVTVTGRFRRDVEDVEAVEEVEAEDGDLSEESGVRQKRQAEKKGSVTVTANHERGRGPQIRTDAQYKAWQSRNGNWQLNGGAFHEAGRGRKPSYGGGVTLTGRFRRDVQEFDEDEAVDAVDEESEVPRNKREANPDGSNGKFELKGIHHPKHGDSHIRNDFNYNLWRSDNKKWELNSNMYHQAGTGYKPSYGGGFNLSGKFRRDVDEPAVVAEDEDVFREKRQADKRGSVTVSAGHQHGRGPQIRTDAQYRAWQSRNGNWQLNGNAFHEAGRGQKPNYGAGVSLTGRF